MTFKRRYFIYRLFDANGALLYVGKTTDFGARLTYHRRPWYTDQAASWDIHDVIDHWTITEVLGDAEAEQAERKAIAEDCPIFNRWRPVESRMNCGPIASRWRAPRKADPELFALINGSCPWLASAVRRKREAHRALLTDPANTG